MGCRKWGVLPVRKGFRVVAAKGALTSESRLTKDEAEGPRKDSGVRQAGASLLGWVSASPNTPRSKVSGSFVPFCLELGLGSPSRSSSGGEMGGHWGAEGWTTWVGGERKRRAEDAFFQPGFPSGLLTHRACRLHGGQGLGLLGLCRF